MTIERFTKEGINYHGIKIELDSCEDLEIFTGSTVMILDSKHLEKAFLVDRNTLININDWLLKDKEGKFSVMISEEYETASINIFKPKCTDGCNFSRSMDQEYPRRCLTCKEIES